MIQELFNVSNKKALITGSGQGIGFMLAKGLARAGSTVILNDIDEKRLESAVASLRQVGFTAHGYLFDVRDEKMIAEQVSRLEQELGSIDILVNNAGIQIRGALEQFDKKDWQKIMDINLTGIFCVSKAVVQGMIKRRNGKIINICSIQSELARPTIAPYTASKGGVKMLTRAMATEWGKYNIQTNAIAPGYLKTELTKPLYEDKKFDSWLCSRTPANRWGEPEELIGAAVFLASQASNYVNGHILFVDGGMSGCV